MTFLSSTMGVLAVVLILLSGFLIDSSSFISAQSPTIDYTQLSISSITSPQCSPTATSVINCTLPADLTVGIDGLPVNRSLSWTSFLFTTTNADVSWTVYCTFTAANPNVCSFTLRMPGYNPAIVSAPVTVALLDYSTGNTSQAFNGLQLAYIPPPQLTSIAGCQGSGMGTFLCVPDRDTLTFYGSGFLLFNDLTSYELLIGNTTNWATYGRGVRVLSDTMMTLYLNSSYSFILQPSHYSGVSMNIAFNLRVFSTVKSAWIDYFLQDGLSISFAPLPPPIFSSATASGGPYGSTFCSRPVNVTGNTFINMIPETCFVLITGDYLYYAQGFLTAPGKGPYPCEVSTQAASAQYLYCNLPLIPVGVDQPGLAWDLTVQTTAGSITLTGAVAFTTSPVITSLVPCTTYARGLTGFASFYTGCMPGSTLVMRTSNFPSATPVTIQLSNYGAALTATCNQATLLTSSSWGCVVPTLNSTTAPVFYGQFNYISALFPSTGQVSPPLFSRIVAYPDSPVILAISGCEVSNGTLVVSRCRSGDVLTVTGTNLNASIPSVSLWDPLGTLSWSCTLLPPLTATSVQCRLPFITQGDSDILDGYAYQGSWTETRPLSGYAWANPFSVSFTWDPRVSPPSQGAASSSTSTAVMVVAVLVPVGVISALVVGWLLYRQLRAAKSREMPSGTANAAGRGDGFSNLEMERQG